MTPSSRVRFASIQPHRWRFACMHACAQRASLSTTLDVPFRQSGAKLSSFPQIFSPKAETRNDVPYSQLPSYTTRISCFRVKISPFPFGYTVSIPAAYSPAPIIARSHSFSHNPNILLPYQSMPTHSGGSYPHQPTAPPKNFKFPFFLFSQLPPNFQIIKSPTCPPSPPTSRTKPNRVSTLRSTVIPLSSSHRPSDSAPTCIST